MKYIMILFVLTGTPRPTVSTPEFNTQEACEEAATDFAKALKTSFTPLYAIIRCYPKG